MDTLLIYLLLLYNVWLVAYILYGRKKKEVPPAEEPSPLKPPQTGDEIVGKSLFKLKPKAPQATIPEPQTATPEEGEELDDIAVTFAGEKEEAPSARLSEDRLDEAFTDIRISDIPNESGDDQPEQPAIGSYATGDSFEEIGQAASVADNPSATPHERRLAGAIYSEMEGDDLFNKMIENNPERAKRIAALMDEASAKPIPTMSMPTDISGFNIRDFV